MKKKHLIAALVSCAAVVTAAAVLLGILLPAREPPTAEEFYRRIYGESICGQYFDRVYYDYDGLMRNADIIAIVTPLDDLTAEASYAGARYLGPDRQIVTFDKIHSFVHSDRKIKVIKYFKDEKGLGDVFTLCEECALSNEGVLVTGENYYPMLKGCTYLVALGNQGLGKPAVLFYENRIDLTHLSFNADRRHTAEVLEGLGLAQYPDESTLTTEYTKRRYRLTLG
ncbi:MAG: hypothetical protein IK101_06210 [Oscillospiraceae bacterium]|nr:hypothetical protein [Oscillospiraceae bacterium]